MEYPGRRRGHLCRKVKRRLVAAHQEMDLLEAMEELEGEEEEREEL